MSTCSVLWNRKTKFNEKKKKKKDLIRSEAHRQTHKQLLPRELWYLRKVTYNSKHEFKNHWLIYGLKWF